MKLYHSITVLLTCSVMAFIFTSGTAFAGKKGKHSHSHSHSHVKGKEGAKKAAEISWDKCCEQNKNDTAKCQGMENVSGKKQNKGTKEKPNWVVNQCPEAKSAAQPAKAKPAVKDTKPVAMDKEAKKEKAEDKKKK